MTLHATQHEFKPFKHLTPPRTHALAAGKLPLYQPDALSMVAWALRQLRLRPAPGFLSALRRCAQLQAPYFAAGKLESINELLAQHGIEPVVAQPGIAMQQAS